MSHVMPGSDECYKGGKEKKKKKEQDIAHTYPSSGKRHWELL